MTGRSGSTPGGVRILDKLRDEGRISAAQYEAAYHHAKRTGGRAEEAVLDTAAMTEADLLKFIAGVYQTRFVSTERLSKADIDRRTLERVPRRVAEHLQVVPVTLDSRTQTLSIVAADLEDDVAKQVQVAANVREVRVFVARPAAIEAAIRFFYGGDRSAFDRVAGPPAGYAASLDVFERGHTSTIGSADVNSFGRDGLDFDFDSRTPNVPLPSAGQLGVDPPRPAAARPAAAQAGAPTPSSLDPLIIEMPKVELKSPDAQTYIATLKVLVGLLDAEREDLRGHSAEVARICERVADRAGVSEGEKHAVVVAAHLHDVGKASAYHLTSLNVSRFDGHRTQAQKSYLAPTRLFEGVGLPDVTIAILTHLYERFDGQGFPDRQEGKEIPWGARLLSMVETYADLVGNPKNPYRRKLKPGEALDVCKQLGGSLFDPTLAALLKKVIRGTVKKPGTAQRVLLVDADPEDTTFVEMRLADAGYEVSVSRDPRDASDLVRAERFDLVLSEVDFPGGGDAFALAAVVKTKDEGSIAFLTRRSDRDAVARGFEAGAADWLIKPVPGALIAAKVTQLLDGGSRKRGGLAGSLRDVSLPDVIQALTNGRKTGLLRISANGTNGEIQFLEGSIANAAFGDVAREEALYSMLALGDGDFSLDPGFKPPARVINASTEALLLEGMRRIDESV